MNFHKLSAGVEASRYWLLNEATWSTNIAATIFAKPGVQQWLNQFGIRANGLQSIGEGGHGRAYASGSKVVKITPDKNEASVSKAAIGKCAHPNLVTVYGVLNVGVVGTREFFLIVVDLVDDVGNSAPLALRQAADLVGGYFDVFQTEFPFDVDHEHRELVKYNADEATDDEDYNNEVAQYAYELLQAVNSIFNTCGLVFIDVGATNVGMSNGKIKLFDLGLSTFS